MMALERRTGQVLHALAVSRIQRGSRFLARPDLVSYNEIFKFFY
jgi:hypothetical protein